MFLKERIKSVVFRLFTEKSILWFIWFSRFLYYGFHLYLELSPHNYHRNSLTNSWSSSCFFSLPFIIRFKTWPYFNTIPPLSSHCQCKKIGAIRCEFSKLPISSLIYLHLYPSFILFSLRRKCPFSCSKLTSYSFIFLIQEIVLRVCCVPGTGEYSIKQDTHGLCIPQKFAVWWERQTITQVIKELQLGYVP